jgi:hypothetical protein
MMLLLLAAMLFHFPAFVQEATADAGGSVVNSSSSKAVIAGSESSKNIEIADATPEAETDGREASRSGTVRETAMPFMPGRLVPEPVPVVGVMTSPAPVVSAAPAIPALPVYSPAKIHPDHRTRRIWLGLSIAQHGGAAFDAWSTRRLISQGGRELNPTLRPFAGNASLYAATQVCPTIFDYLSRRMMTSRRGWVRYSWWIPQTVSAALSVASGVHNSLGVYSAR